MKLEELIRLDKRGQINRLYSEKKELEKELKPLTDKMKELAIELSGLETDKYQVVVEYYIEKLVKEAIAKYSLKNWVKEYPTHTNLAEGMIAIYDDYVGSTWYVIVDEDLNIVDMKGATDFTVYVR